MGIKRKEKAAAEFSLQKKDHYLQRGSETLDQQRVELSKKLYFQLSHLKPPGWHLSTF